jgi:hypothetical protein
LIESYEITQSFIIPGSPALEDLTSGGKLAPSTSTNQLLKRYLSHGPGKIPSVPLTERRKAPKSKSKI